MDTADILTLPPKVLDAFEQIQKWQSELITQAEAARVLGCTERHFRRLIRRYEASGIPGLCTKVRRPGNQISPEVRTRAIALIKEHFYDYGPTLAAEKLGEYFGIKISKETARKWMISEQLWHPSIAKIPRPHPPRPRRAHLGELVQVDGSYHHWFEDRGPKACLLVFIDDATGKLLNLRFAPAETSIDYLDTLKEYILNHGVPRALYFDKHGVFRVRQAVEGTTQFLRVMEHLNIRPIYAHSPQAKGRVERVNSTLQDRLIKELRFFEINNVEDANLHAQSFIKRFNEKFSAQPQDPVDLHRPLPSSELQSLDFLCSIQTPRIVSKDLIVKHNKSIFKLIRGKKTPKRLAKQKVIVCENKEGTSIYLNGQQLPYEVVSRPKRLAPILDRKNMDQFLDSNPELKHYWWLMPQ